MVVEPEHGACLDHKRRSRQRPSAVMPGWMSFRCVRGHLDGVVSPLKVRLGGQGQRLVLERPSPGGNSRLFLLHLGGVASRDAHKDAKIKQIGRFVVFSAPKL